MNREILINKAVSKIKLLPESKVQEVNDFVDFLFYKNRKDWYEELSSEQIKSIKQGLNDIENGKVYDHNVVMEEMAQYIKSKKG